MRRRVLVVSAIGFLFVGAVALGGRVDKAPARTEDIPEFVRIDKARLFQSSGEELYKDLCASCHGASVRGEAPAVDTRLVSAPRLDQLEKRGVAKEHWTYVITAPYEDQHHWGPDGNETMPCWNRLFRQAMGSEAGPLLVSSKLVDYLEEIQE